MKVIVDTCIWSDAFRRSAYDKENRYVKELKNLINDGRVQMIGPVRQEILSGIRFRKQFEKLKKLLQTFPDIDIKSNDFETAAMFYNLCRKEGIQGSNTDFLICALSSNNNLPIFTRDNDFELFRPILNIKLHTVQY